MAGLLIVNADDVGFSRRVTDAAIQAFQAGAISSGTTMVWMRDSSRAVAAARELGLPLGLHLNFTDAFAAPSVPRAARDRQLRLLEHFSRRGDGGRDSPARAVVRDAVLDQLEHLTGTYGEPTHVDGHHHVHLRDQVLEVIPGWLPVRPPLSRPGETDPRSTPPEPLPGRRSPRWAVALQQVHPDLGGQGEAALAGAREDALEVMAHPADDGQLAALIGEAWQAMTAGLTMGSYAGLPGPDTARSGG